MSKSPHFFKRAFWVVQWRAFFWSKCSLHAPTVSGCDRFRRIIMNSHDHLCSGAWFQLQCIRTSPLEGRKPFYYLECYVNDHHTMGSTWDQDHTLENCPLFFLAPVFWKIRPWENLSDLENFFLKHPKFLNVQRFCLGRVEWEGWAAHIRDQRSALVLILSSRLRCANKFWNSPHKSFPRL